MEWQPIETAPKDGRMILVRDSRGRREVARMQDGRWLTSAYSLIKTTSWLAIPEQSNAAHERAAEGAMSYNALTPGLKKTDVLWVGWTFYATIGVKPGTPLCDYLKDVHLNNARVKGLVQDFGYSGEVAIIENKVNYINGEAQECFVFESI